MRMRSWKVLKIGALPLLLAIPVICGCGRHVSSANTNCDSAAVQAAMAGATINLSSCAGTVGLRPTPTLRAAVGDIVTISFNGVQPGTLTSSSSAVEIDGREIIPLQRGTANVGISGGPSCTSSSATNSCQLVVVIVP